MPVPATALVTPVLVTVTAPVAPLTLMPVPAMLLVTPVLVTVMSCDPVVATNQVSPLRFCFKGLRGNPLAKPLGTLIVTPAHFAGLEACHFGLRTAVALADAPTGQPRELRIQPTWIGEGIVVPTRDGQLTVSNRLSFALMNPGDGPWVSPKMARIDVPRPTFSVHFMYATDRPGHGALCTAGYARARAASSAPEPTLRTTDGRWVCTPQQSASGPGPYWTVQPAEDNHALLAAGATLELFFEDVASDLGLDAQGDPDVTLMIVLWENIPGCLPGSRFHKHESGMSVAGEPKQTIDRDAPISGPAERV